MFFDEAKIHVQSGNGGDGVVTFRREKFVPRGGPSGGDGGDGGDVVLEVDPQLNTLVHFQGQTHFKAERGVHGRSKNQTGARGEDVIVPVPPGTIVRDADTGALLADLTEPGQRVIVAKGGQGGRGNARFTTSTRQAPRIAEKGQAGQGRWLSLELKLLADVGLVGMPNAGKSTLLSVVSAARPKIADYPFTTLQPNLGVVSLDQDTSFVLADLPGLIEGAHSGAGLGHQFLRHVERTRLLIHLLDGAGEHPLDDFNQINDELELFNPKLAQRPQIVVLNKMDLPQAQEMWPSVKAAIEARGLPVMAISAVSGEGVRQLMGTVAQLLTTLPEPEAPEADIPVFKYEEAPVFSISRENGGWRVTGAKVEELVSRTLWQYNDAVQRAQRQLEALGVFDALRQAGVQTGDSVFIGDHEMEWVW